MQAQAGREASQESYNIMYVPYFPRAYNRARQAGITQEIAEVVGGGAAVE
jgi:F0F1-type ATP synthase gamma subunit